MTLPSRLGPSINLGTLLLALTTPLSQKLGAQGSPQVPQLDVVDSQIVLHLSPPMQAALNAYDRTFRPWALNEYEGWVLGMQGMPAAVVGDFNGDGRLDIAADGRTATSSTLIVILSDRNRYHVLEIKKGSLPVNGQIPGNMGAPSGRNETYLTLQAPGDVHAGVGPPVIHLHNDAFAIWHEEKSTELCYWHDGAFECTGIGD